MHESIHNAPKQTSLKQYRKAKLKMLNEFYIYPTLEQLDHINKLETEVAIDNYCISLIENGLKTYKGN